MKALFGLGDKNMKPLKKNDVLIKNKKCINKNKFIKNAEKKKALSSWFILIPELQQTNIHAGLQTDRSSRLVTFRNPEPGDVKYFRSIHRWEAKSYWILYPVKTKDPHRGRSPRGLHSSPPSKIGATPFHLWYHGIYTAKVFL